jgi:chaperonin GroES
MAKAINVQPIGGYILVKPEQEEEKTASGLIIQTEKNEKPQRGEIITLGTGKLDDNGKQIPWNVKVGDTVIFKKYSPEEMEINGEEYLLMQESDILAVVK